MNKFLHFITGRLRRVGLVLLFCTVHNTTRRYHAVLSHVPLSVITTSALSRLARDHDNRGPRPRLYIIDIQRPRQTVRTRPEETVERHKRSSSFLTYSVHRPPQSFNFSLIIFLVPLTGVALFLMTVPSKKFQWISVDVRAGYKHPNNNGDRTEKGPLVLQAIRQYMIEFKSNIFTQQSV